MARQTVKYSLKTSGKAAFVNALVEMSRIREMSFRRLVLEILDKIENYKLENTASLLRSGLGIDSRTLARVGGRNYKKYIRVLTELGFLSWNPAIVASQKAKRCNHYFINLELEIELDPVCFAPKVIVPESSVLQVLRDMNKDLSLQEMELKTGVGYVTLSRCIRGTQKLSKATIKKLKVSMPEIWSKPEEESLKAYLSEVYCIAC